MATPAGENPITLMCLVQSARRIRDQLDSKIFDLREAEKEAKQLLKHGERWALHEQRGERLVMDIVSPVFVELIGILSMDAIQHQVMLLLPVARACCMFIEITWHQCLWRVEGSGNQTKYVWRQQPISTVPSTQKQILQVVQGLMSALPENLAAEVRFELSCVEEASKWLVPTQHIQHILSDCLDSGISAVASAMKRNPATAFCGTLTAMHEFFKKWREGNECKSMPWYLPLHEMRWAALGIAQVEDFEAIIGNKSQELLNMGPESAEGLAIVLMRIIENKGMDNTVRLRALRGSGQYGGLLCILRERQKLRNVDFTLSIGRILKDLTIECAWAVSRLAGQPLDRYRKARFLIMQFLGKLLHDEEYHEFHHVCHTSLRELQTDVSEENNAGAATRARELRSRYADGVGTVLGELERKLARCRSFGSMNARSTTNDFIGEVGAGDGSRIIAEECSLLSKQIEFTKNELSKIQENVLEILVQSLESQGKEEEDYVDMVLQSVQQTVSHQECLR
eukprot:evm.model.scf_552.3 EVM.evm.TU.scf_552.3   scf_552:38401-39933(-)